MPGNGPWAFSGLSAFIPPRPGEQPADPPDVVNELIRDALHRYATHLRLVLAHTRIGLVADVHQIVGVRSARQRELELLPDLAADLIGERRVRAVGLA